MELTERHIRLIGIIGFTLLVLATPVMTVYAMDYRLIEKQRPPASPPPVWQYQNLNDAQQRAVDQAIADEGVWYRTRAELPFYRMPIRVYKNEDVHTFGLTEQYHWNAWYGKIPVATFGTGILMIAITLRFKIRQRTGVPVRT